MPKQAVKRAFIAKAGYMEKLQQRGHEWVSQALEMFPGDCLKKPLLRKSHALPSREDDTFTKT